MISKLRKERLIKRLSKEGQTTFIFCTCGNELCSTSFISDTYEGKENHVRYKCSTCDKEHDYNFDIAPVPISYDELNK